MPGIPTGSAGPAPDVLDIGQLGESLRAVPSVVKRESGDLLRTVGQFCFDPACSASQQPLGTSFEITVGGKIYDVTAEEHVEKADGISCKDQYIVGRRPDEQIVSTGIRNRKGTFKPSKNDPESSDYSVPDIGMFQPDQPTTAAALPLVSSIMPPAIGTVVYAIGYSPTFGEQGSVFPPSQQYPLPRNPNIVGGVVLGQIAGAQNVSVVLEVNGGVVQGNSGGPLMKADGVVEGVLSATTDPLPISEIEQDTGFSLTGVSIKKQYSLLYVQDVNTSTAGLLAENMSTHPGC